MPAHQQAPFTAVYPKMHNFGDPAMAENRPKSPRDLSSREADARFFPTPLGLSAVPRKRCRLTKLPSGSLV